MGRAWVEAERVILLGSDMGKCWGGVEGVEGEEGVEGVESKGGGGELKGVWGRGLGRGVGGAKGGEGATVGGL